MPRRAVVAVLLVLVVAAGAGLFLFQPWKAFTDTTVNVALPVVSAPATAPEKDSGPRELTEGSFVTHDHDTSGTARTIRLADGGQLLRLEDLRTSEGPDVRVYLSTRSARAAREGLGSGAVELGGLKGNLGDQNYTVPADTDVSRFRSVVIWCERFSVSFGAADLSTVKS